MIKCTEAIFVQTSPSTFFRPIKSTKNHEEDQQISESEVIQKLHLILISIREQASKTQRYFKGKMDQLQSKLNYQIKLKQSFQTENKLLTNFLDTYPEKYGQLGPQIRQLETIKQARSQLCIQWEQNILKNEVRKQANICLKQSNLSTNYKSNYRQSSRLSQSSSNKVKSKSVSQTEDSYLQPETYQNLTRQSFYKKSTPCYAETNRQEQFCQVLAQSSIKDKFPNQRSQISQIESIQSSEINRIPEEEQQESIDCLGLQSKSGKFYKGQEINFKETQDESLLLSSLGQGESLKMVEQANKADQPYDYYEEFEPLKTDSDIKRMRSVLQGKFPVVKTETIQFMDLFLNGQKQNETSKYPPNQECLANQLKNLNHSYYKSLKVHQSRVRQIDCVKENLENPKQQVQVQSMRTQLRQVQRKLKALFQPLSPNIVSKKVALPKVTQQTKNYQTRESVDFQKLSELFSPYSQLKLVRSEIQADKQKKLRARLNKQFLD